MFFDQNHSILPTFSPKSCYFYQKSIKNHLFLPKIDFFLRLYMKTPFPVPLPGECVILALFPKTQKSGFLVGQNLKSRGFVTPQKDSTNDPFPYLYPGNPHFGTFPLFWKRLLPGGAKSQKQGFCTKDRGGRGGSRGGVEDGPRAGEIPRYLPGGDQVTPSPATP